MWEVYTKVPSTAILTSDGNGHTGCFRPSAQSLGFDAPRYLEGRKSYDVKVYQAGTRHMGTLC